MEQTGDHIALEADPVKLRGGRGTA